MRKLFRFNNPKIYLNGFIKYKYFLAITFFIILDIALLFIWQFHTKSITAKQNTLDLSYSEVADLTQHPLEFPQLRTYFLNLAEKKGAVYAYEVLKRIPVLPGTDMHLMGHVVGDVLYKQEGIDGIKYCTQDFRNACSHTIVVGLLLDKGEQILPKIAEVCKQAPGGPGAYTMCYHGLGHGVLAYTNYDLPKAIQLCSKTNLANPMGEEFSQCVGGEIMEIISGGDHDKLTWTKQNKLYLTSENPLSPCNADYMPKEARFMCYTYLTPHLFQVAGMDLGQPQEQYYKKAFSYCDQIPNTESANQQACYGGFGKEFVVIAKDRDIRTDAPLTPDQSQKIEKWCNATTFQKGVEYCMLSALSSIYWGGENSADGAITFCTSIKDDSLKNSCMTSLFGQVNSYHNEKDYKVTVCSKISSNYMSLCKKTLNIE